jgi:hypothetical protein
MTRVLNPDPPSNWLAAASRNVRMPLVALGRSPGGHLHAPAHAVQQQIQPGQGVVHAEALVDGCGDARQRPALVGSTPRARAGVEQHL